METFKKILRMYWMATKAIILIVILAFGYGIASHIFDPPTPEEIAQQEAEYEERKRIAEEKRIAELKAKEEAEKKAKEEAEAKRVLKEYQKKAHAALFKRYKDIAWQVSQCHNDVRYLLRKRGRWNSDFDDYPNFYYYTPKESHGSNGEMWTHIESSDRTYFVNSIGTREYFTYKCMVTYEYDEKKDRVSDVDVQLTWVRHWGDYVE